MEKVIHLSLHFNARYLIPDLEVELLFSANDHILKDILRLDFPDSSFTCCDHSFFLCKMGMLRLNETRKHINVRDRRAHNISYSI